MKTNYQNTSMLDMVFENRNRSYGAYVLRKDYDKMMAEAAFITYSIILLLFLGKFITDKLQGTKVCTDPIATVVTLVDPAKLVIEMPKPVEEAQHSKPKATSANTEMHVVANNQQATDTNPPHNELALNESGLAKTLGANDGSGLSGATGTGTGLEDITPVQPMLDNTVHDWVDTMPAFPGGEQKLMEFLVHHTRYPDYEKENAIQGKTYVKFVVNEDGSVSDPEIIRSETKGFSKEALRVVGLLPKFNPGKQHSKAVKVRYTLPFYFKMDK